ncbi:MAG: radical SAM protein [Candidatus Krumholzibacteriota bacterium]|nr:radical SAM protein [Candidatus Krumholzibacteriota bacterium]
MMHLPIDAVTAITYRCDSRCNMCNIWKLPPGAEMPAAAYTSLPETLNDVNITGGEPFLRDDIVELVREIHEKAENPRIVISTNGFQSKKIAHVAPKLLAISKKVGIAVSLDGIGEVHDRIRGVDGGFEKVLETLNQLKRIGYRNVRVAFTAQKENVKHLGAVYDLSRQYGYQFTTSVVQNSEFYFSTSDNQQVDPGDLERELKYVMKKELFSLSPKRWLRAYFYSGVLRYNMAGERALGCRAGRDSVFIDPEGKVYPCLTLEKEMGNLNESSFKEIWNSEKAEKARKAVDSCRLPCWMICTARVSMKRNPIRPIWWILKNWARLLLGAGISVT